MRAAKLALLPFEAVVLRCVCTLEGFIMLLGEAVEWKDETYVAGSNPRPKKRLFTILFLRPGKPTIDL